MSRLWMLSLMCFVALGAYADTIVFKNGQELVGKIIEEKPEFLILQVEYGTLHVDREKVAKIEIGEVAMKQGSGTGGGSARSAGAASGNEDLSKMVAEKIKERKARDPQAQAQAGNNKGAAKPGNQTSGQAGGTAQNGNQQSWADNYVNWRRTFRTKEEGELRPTPNSSTRNSQNNPNSSADRMTSRNGNSGGSAPRYSGNGSVPNGMKNLPPDLMKQVQQYLPK